VGGKPIEDERGVFQIAVHHREEISDLLDDRGRHPGLSKSEFRIRTHNPGGTTETRYVEGR
jgi:hypothetical protein